MCLCTHPAASSHCAVITLSLDIIILCVLRHTCDKRGCTKMKNKLKNKVQFYTTPVSAAASTCILTEMHLCISENCCLLHNFLIFFSFSTTEPKRKENFKKTWISNTVFNHISLNITVAAKIDKHQPIFFWGLWLEQVLANVVLM